MDGGVPWAPDPMEAMDSMRGIISMGNPYQPQTSVGNSYEQQTTVGNPYQQQTTVGNPYQPQTMVGNPYQSQTTLANSYQSQTTLANSYQPQTTVGNPYQPQTTPTQTVERISQPTEAVILMHNLFDHSQPEPAWTSNQVVAPVQTVYQPQTSESIPTVYQPHTSEPSQTQVVAPVQTVYQPRTTEPSQTNEAMMAVGTVYRSPVIEGGNQIQKGVLSAEQLMFNTGHGSEENSKDGGEATEYYVPCGEAFDLSELYAQATQENQGNRSEFPSIAADTQSTSRPILSSTLSEDCGENVTSFKDERSESIPRLPMLIQENSKVGEKVETDGGEKSKEFLVAGGSETSYIMSDESSPTIEEQMRAIHGPTPSPVPGPEEASTIISPHISKVSPLPDMYARVAQDELKSPEQTAGVVMDDMLKKIFVGEDATQATGVEDEEVANIMGSPDNNFVNVSQYVVNQSIPLRFDPLTGEMVPDLGTDVKIQQNAAFNDFKQDPEFLAKSKSSNDKNIGKVKPISPSKNIAKVAPLPASTPLQLVTVVSASATPSSTPRKASIQKCSCLKHSVLGYPPSQVVYWTVRTTPAIRKTVIDFDNDGVKFLYDDGCLKAFETVLKSFTPEFLSSEKSLEVSLCLSCVRWAEGEAKEGKQSLNSKIEKSVKPLKSAKPLKKVKERNNLNKSIGNENKVDVTANVEEKRRKRGRSQTPEAVKKPRTSSETENASKKSHTSPKMVKKARTSSDNENVYKKEYTSRRSAWIVGEPKKEENKNPKVVMYDLYCDIPGCNARLRGYPSLIKHFKAKHPDESVVGEGTKDLDDKTSVSVGGEIKDLDDKKGGVSAGKESCVNEVDKIVEFVNDPKKKLKAMHDMKLLHVKVEKLKNMPLPPPPSSCLKDKRLTEIHAEPGQGKRKSVEFKETLVIHTISPRRKHETRSRGNETLEMLAPIDLNSPPKPKIIKLNLDDDKNPPNTSDETIAKEKSTSDSNPVSSKSNVPNLNQSSELIHSDETSEAPSTKIVGEKENIKVPKVMLKEIGISPQNSPQPIVSSPSLPEQKRKEMDKLRIDMVPEVLSPRRGSRSTRGVQKSQAEPTTQLEPDQASVQNIPPSPLRSSRSAVAEAKEVSGLKESTSQLDKVQNDDVSKDASPARASRSSKALLKSPVQINEQISVPSPVRASRSAAVELNVSDLNSPGRPEKLSKDEVPNVANSAQATRSTRGSHASSKSELKPQSDQNAVIIPLRLKRSAAEDSKSLSNNKTSPSQHKQKVNEGSPAEIPVRTSRSSKAAPKSLSELSNQSESKTVHNNVTSEAVTPIQASRLEKSELETPNIESHGDEVRSPTQSKDITSTRRSRSMRTESSSVEEIESKSSLVQKSQLDKLRIDMVPEAISPRRANRSTRSASKDQSQPEALFDAISPRRGNRSSRSASKDQSQVEAQLEPKNKAKAVEHVNTVTSAENTPRKTRRSSNLEVQKSPSKQIEKNSDLRMKIIYNDNIEVASGEPMTKATRSGTLVTNGSQHGSEKPTDDHSNDFSEIFANIDAGILTINLAAKQEGLKPAQMHDLYNQYKADKLKAKSDKTNPSNKMKSKSRIPSNLSSEESADPPEKEDLLQSTQEAVSAVELPREPIDSGDHVKYRSDGIKKVKEDLMKHLSSAEPLSVADKKSLLEVVGVINEALLKNL